MRLSASANLAFEVAYDILKNGDKPKVLPGTTVEIRLFQQKSASSARAFSFWVETPDNFDTFSTS